MHFLNQWSDWPCLRLLWLARMIIVVLLLTILDCQSLYCIIRILLETHESAVISVWRYDREKENQVQHFNLRINKLLRFVGICLQMLSNIYLTECLPSWLIWSGCELYDSNCLYVPVIRKELENNCRWGPTELNVKCCWTYLVGPLAD